MGKGSEIMGKVYVVTDSTADLSVETKAEYGIVAVALGVHFGEQMYRDGVDLFSDTFYEKLATSIKLPTTSQPSPADFRDVYQQILDKDAAAQIWSIHISSVLSGTYQSAVLGKSMLGTPDAVTVIDSKSASYGLGYMALQLAEAAARGDSRQQALQLVADIQREHALYFVVDTLEYLQKGGRIGKAAALVGSLLNIKPILTVDSEGEVASVDKVRGQKKAMSRLLELLARKFSPTDPVQVFIPHSLAEQTADELSAQIKSRFDVRHLAYTPLGPVIGTHVGPGTVGVLMVPYEG